jgi:tetratricopeptide (TPR) repeat protein
MPTAIIIVILIVCLSIGLFSLIKKLSDATNTEPEMYPEEGSITDFNSIPKISKEIIDENHIKKSSPKVNLAIFISSIYRFVNNQMQNLKSLQSRYQQRKFEKIKQKEKAIQEAIKKDQELYISKPELENSKDKELDTSYFEIENANIINENNNLDVDEINTVVISETKTNPDTKVKDFVEQLLSEVDAISDATAKSDISDTYYYEYMEKRYIDRIVANSKDIEAYKKLGDLYVDMRNYKDALEAFEYVLKLKPNDTIANRRVKDISNRLQKQN